jgi:acylphosphatase
MKQRAHLIISGRVQGVCYRAFAKEEATKLGLSGWIRNLPTGQVEAVFEGERATLEPILQWCHKGPDGAKVSEVDLAWEELKSEFDDFRIIVPVANEDQ